MSGQSIGPIAFLRTNLFALTTAAAVSSGTALAAPITVLDPNGYLLVDQRANNSLGRGTGERIAYGANVLPNGSAGTTGSAETTDLSTGLTSKFALPFNGSPALPNQFANSIKYNPDLAGPWTLSFQNGSDTRTVKTPSIVGATPPPFATNVTVSGLSTNPTFTWSYPAGSVNGVFFDLYDKSVLNASGNPALVYTHALPGTTNSFTVPNDLAGGLLLTQNHQYTLDLYGVVTRDGTTTLNNPNSLAWSESYFDFKPTVTGGPPVNLPALTSSGAYQFSMVVLPGTTYYIDPAVATGYDYEIGAGDPSFASVTLPGVQPGAYDVSYSLDNKTVDVMVAPNASYSFPTGGVAGFRVTGIDPALGLSPADTTAFVTGLTFAGNGVFDGNQTPITTDITDVPEPGTMPLLAVALCGLAGIGGWMKPRISGGRKNP